MMCSKQAMIIILDESPYCEFISGFDDEVRFPAPSACDQVKLTDLCNKMTDCGDGIDERYCPHLKFCDVNNASSGQFDDRLCGSDR